jgi:hypothetical protein
MAYYKTCPDCRGHGVIDHVNFTRPGPCLWTVPCRRCMPMRVVIVEKDELVRYPAPDNPAPLSTAKEKHQ